MKTAEQLIECIKAPQKVGLEDVSDLKDILQKYPYFQAAHMLVAKATYEKNAETVSVEVQRAAIYATDRNYLRSLLDENPPFTTQVGTSKESISISGTSTPVTIENIAEAKPLKTTEVKKREQYDSIEKFIQMNIKFSPDISKEAPTDLYRRDLTEESTTFSDELATENLAQIMFQQGKIDKALDIYEKLILKFPQKKTYLASIAQELKTQK